MFLLFAGHKYYPKGGSEDFRGEFESIEQAKQHVRDNKADIADSTIDIWADIIEKETMKSVSYGLIDESLISNTEKWWPGVDAYIEYDEKT